MRARCGASRARYRRIFSLGARTNVAENDGAARMRREAHRRKAGFDCRLPVCLRSLDIFLGYSRRCRELRSAFRRRSPGCSREMSKRFDLYVSQGAFARGAAPSRKKRTAGPRLLAVITLSAFYSMAFRSLAKASALRARRRSSM